MLGDNDGKLLGAVGGEPDGSVVGSSLRLLGDDDGLVLGDTLGNPVGPALAVCEGPISSATDG